MLKIGKLTDYAIVCLYHLNNAGDHACLNAQCLSDKSKIPMPTVAKVLKIMGKGGLIKSVRGIHGGYALTRPVQQITILEILDIMEGKVALTDCVDGVQNPCIAKKNCPLSGRWDVVNKSVRKALHSVTLHDMFAVKCAIQDAPVRYSAIADIKRLYDIADT
jgi:FeS assembly SUF system regulator